jgi:serine/threonine protein kinase
MRAFRRRDAAANEVKVVPERKPPGIFVSYSHHDAEWRQRLFGDYVSTTFGDCRVWTDAQIRAGDRWNEEIQRRLESSTVAVLLVSDHFLNSDFITTREYPTILDRARNSGLRIVWIPIAVARDTLEKRRPELVDFQGASGFENVLPSTPQDCSAPTLERVRQHIREQMESAVDPLGADLARTVAHRYDVEHLLGEGNRAAVYKARDLVLQRAVAIKVPKDKDQRQAFMTDVRDATRTSEESNFINIYDAATEELSPYCVIQYTGGKTLEAFIREHPRGLPVETFRRIFTRVTAAISRAHALGVTYGNIKPSNIMLDENNEPFILPVGRRRDRARDEKEVAELVERLAQQKAAGLPARESDLEDLAYLVPDHFGEQLEPVDPRLSDQYMLGVLSYEMATGARPNVVPQPERLFQDGRAAFRALPPITKRNRLCPQRITALVARMASRLPAKRFPDLQAALQETDLLDDLSLVIARDSYRRCAAVPGFDSEFFERFYDEFLQRCPEARAFFEGFVKDDWTRQHRMLKEAVLLLFAFRQQSEGHAEPNVLSRIADSHAKIPGSFYDPFIDALVRTVCGDEAGGLAPFDPESADATCRDILEEHWRSALESGVNYMKMRAAVAPGTGR